MAQDKTPKNKYLVKVPGVNAEVSCAFSLAHAVTQRVANLCGRNSEMIRGKVAQLKQRAGLEGLGKFAIQLPYEISSEYDLMGLEIDVTHFLAGTDGNQIDNSNRMDYLDIARKVLTRNGYRRFY